MCQKVKTSITISEKNKMNKPLSAKLGSHCRSDQLDDPDCLNFHDQAQPNS